MHYRVAPPVHHLCKLLKAILGPDQSWQATPCLFAFPRWAVVTMLFLLLPPPLHAWVTIGNRMQATSKVSRWLHSESWPGRW